MKKILAVLFCLGAFFFALFHFMDEGNTVPSETAADDCGEKCRVPERTHKGRRPVLKPEDLVPAESSSDSLRVELFYSSMCPHCASAIKFLDEIKKPDPDSRFFREVERFRSETGVLPEVHSYEITENSYNRELFEHRCSSRGVVPSGMPVIFAGKEYVAAFPEDSGPKSLADAMLRAQGIEVQTEEHVYHIPVLGRVEAESVFMPVFTVFTGFLDGLNPCAMWVLVFLLGLMAYSRSRKRMIIVGLTFAAASGTVYFALMAAWLNFFMILGFNRPVMIILGAAALVMGLVNLKELFFFKKGVSLMIPESAKPGIYRRGRRLLKEKSLFLTVCMTFLFALFVNLIELACTAGLPAIFTKILADRNETAAARYLYMVLYNLVYIVPLLIIVLIFVFTMGHFKIQEKHAKVLKCISGFLMLVLGTLMLVKPEVLLW